LIFVRISKNGGDLEHAARWCERTQAGSLCYITPSRRHCGLQQKPPLTFPNFAPFNPGFVPLPLFARRCTSSGAERRRSTKYRTLMSHKSKSSPFHFCVLERHNLGMEHRRQPLCCLRATEPGQRFCGFCYGTRLCRTIRPWRASDDRYGCRLL
jgi:hypothetical protein